MEVIDSAGNVICRMDDREQTTALSTGLIVTPHPVTLDGQRITAESLLHGENLLAFLERVAPDVVAGNWAVAINGSEVPARFWPLTRPKAGVIISCRRLVRQDVLKIGALIAISYFTLGPGGLGTSGLFSGGGLIGGGFLAAAGAYVAGTMLINKLLGPKQPDAATLQSQAAGTTYSLSGGSNQRRPYEPLGLLFGEVRVSPDFSSQPFGWFEGKEQYLYENLHGGINCGSVSDVRIGKTPLTSYSDWDSAATGFSAMPDQPLLNWANVDTIAGARLTGGPDLGGWQDYTPGEWVTRTTSAGTVFIQVDIEGSLYFTADNGSGEERTADIEVQHRLLPDGDWELLELKRYRSSRTDPIRDTLNYNLAEGQHEIRIRKNTTDKNMGREQNTFAWSYLKSIQRDGGYYTGIGRFGLKIRASGQINGTLDTVNWLARAKAVSLWNGSAWVTAATRAEGLNNPGALMLQYIRGIYDSEGRLQAGMGLSDDMIDLESLQGFMVRCAAMRFTFDWYVDQTTSHQEVLSNMAAAGMGSVAWPRGKLGVIWFQENEPVSGVVNMATMTAGSFKIDYLTLDTADGLEYQYFDRAQDFTWVPVRVKSPGVDVPLNPSKITSVGVTEEVHAALLARFHMAQSIYQRKSISFTTDLEHLTYQRGSVLMLSHDVTQWGYGGRLQDARTEAGLVHLTLDDFLPSGGGGYIGLRLLGDRSYTVFAVQALSEESREIVLGTAWPELLPFPGTGGSAVHDVIWIYDFKTTPGYRVRVTEVQPDADLATASVTCVPEGPEFWDYVLNGTYEPPPNQSRLQGLPEVQKAEISEQLDRQGNTFALTLTATLDIVGSFARAEIWGGLGGASAVLLGSTENREFKFAAGLDDKWELTIRPFDGLGRLGKPLQVHYEVVGLRYPPSDVSWLSINGNTLTWQTVNDADLAGYIIRFHYGYNRSWGDANPLHEGIVTATPYTPDVTPQGPVTLMIRSIDTTGNLSVGTAYLQTGFGDPIVANVVQTVDFAALGFPGVVIGGSVEGGHLKANGTSVFFGNDLGSFYSQMGDTEFYQDQFEKLVYETSSFTPVVQALGSNMTLDCDLLGGARSIEYRAFDGESFYVVDPTALFYSKADGESFYPAPPDYQPWPGAVQLQALSYQFRLTVEQGGTRGEIDACAAVIDVPDIEESFSLIDIPAGGVRLPIRKKYMAITNVQLTLHSDSSDVAQIKWIDKNPVLGPLVVALTSAGVPTAGKGDARIQGY